MDAIESTITTGSLVEGISNEVLIAVILGIAGMFMLMAYKPISRSTDIHPDSQEAITATRERLQNRPREADSDTTCPICLGSVRYGLETNCGHLFCGNCLITYWKTGRWLGAVACPVCRQTVTVLLLSFTENELREESPDKDSVLGDVHTYNRRFSGEPRSIWEYIQDLPTVLRHAISDLFSMDGMILMFRIRILVCLVLAVLYFLSPLDIIPEVAVGLLGFVDDLFIMFIVAIYITMIYRSVLANRGS